MSKAVQTTEANADALSAIVDKALGFPVIGTHIGGGRHVTMPPTWDGQGGTPPGWTKRANAIFVLSASDAWYELPDNAVTLMRGIGVTDRAREGANCIRRSGPRDSG